MGKHYHFEGERGLEELCERIEEFNGRGMIQQMQLKNGAFVSSFTNFLEDNPGCIQAIHEWLDKNYNEEDQWESVREGNELPEYSNANYIKFAVDCDRIGLPVEHYEGRGGYNGPAVRTDHKQTVLAATKIECQFDNMGKGWIAYPKS